MKKIISVLCICLLVSSSAFASVKPENQNEDTIIISGTSVTDAGEKVTVTVFPYGENFDSADVKYGLPSEIPSYINVARADQDGNVAFRWTAQKSGFYDVYYSSDGEIKGREEKVYIPSGAKALYDKVRSGSVEELKTELSGEGRILDLLRNEEEVSLVSAKNLSNAIFNIREASTDSDTEKIIIAAKNLSILASQKTADSLDAALSSLNDAGVTLSFVTNYNTYATSDIKAEMALKTANICDKTVPQINSYLNNAFILAGVYKSQNWMDGADFLKILGYPSGNESKINKAARAVTGTKYDTISDLKDAIDIATGGSSGGGGGGAAGGSSSAGGNTTPSRVDASKPDVKIDVGNVDTGNEQDDIFADVKNTHYAFDDINYLRWHQVVSGDDKGNFNPDMKITRAEVLKMLCEVFGVQSNAASSFNDVEADSWYAGFVGGAYSAGLIKGGDEGNFNPNENITRQDLAVMLYRFCEYSENKLDGEDVSFSDKGDISDYALTAVSALCANGIINGMDDNTFLPFEGATRAQTACMLARYMRNFGKGGI